MKINKILKISVFLSLLASVAFLFQSCSTFNYKTYDEKKNENIDDPEPNYNITLDEDFQDFTSFMFIGNRIENFTTYFNTYFNAKENFDDAYQDYSTRVLANYSERLGSIFEKPTLSQEAKDKFNTAIEKASKVIQYHKSSQFMDKSVLLIGKSYYYLGDYLKAERKFGEFISKLSASSQIEEAVLFLSKTQLRLDNEKPALERLGNLLKTSKNPLVVSESYQSLAEYYLYKKDYPNAIKNFKKAIEFSKDSEFKAQMQFLVASVTSLTNPGEAAREFDKVLDYNASFDLEYLARYNYAKNMVISGEYRRSQLIIEDLLVRYKDNPVYLGQVSYLNGFNQEQKKNYKNALELYYEVIRTYPNSVPSSDASFRIGNYYESRNDYLNALRYYRFSTEQSTAGSNHVVTLTKVNTFKRYFELRSVITGNAINTDYDSDFKRKTGTTPPEGDPDKNNNPGEGDKGGNSGGKFLIFADSVITDSTRIKAEAVATAKYELAELFLYNLNRPDSCEIYLNQAFSESGEDGFKAKVLFALASLYRSVNNNEKSDDILRKIINDYPSTDVANSSRRLLNLSVVEEVKTDSSDSLFYYSENKFLNREYEAALNGFSQLIKEYPSSVYLDKALYANGWIYENVYIKPDSAYIYYSSLIKTLPNSEPALLIAEKVTEYETFNNTPVDTSGKSTDTSGVKTDSSNVKSPEGNIDPQQLLKEFEESKKDAENKNEPLREEIKKEEDIETEPKNDDGSK